MRVVCWQAECPRVLKSWSISKGHVCTVFFYTVCIKQKNIIFALGAIWTHDLQHSRPYSVNSWLNRKCLPIAWLICEKQVLHQALSHYATFSCNMIIQHVVYEYNKRNMPCNKNYFMKMFHATTTCVTNTQNISWNLFLQ